MIRFRISTLLVLASFFLAGVNALAQKGGYRPPPPPPPRPVYVPPPANTNRRTPATGTNTSSSSSGSRTASTGSVRTVPGRSRPVPQSTVRSRPQPQTGTRTPQISGVNSVRMGTPRMQRSGPVAIPKLTLAQNAAARSRLSSLRARLLASSALRTRRQRELAAANSQLRNAAATTHPAPAGTQNPKPNSVGMSGAVANMPHEFKRQAEAKPATDPAAKRLPYENGSRAREIVLEKETLFVRVHGEGNQARSWMMRPEAIKGLTPQQIKDKFALPELPKYVSDVHVPAGTRLRAGTAGKQESWGEGGGTQYELKEKLPDSAFRNRRPLQ
jgi:hypothetical protein